jgi:histone H3/H4
MSIRQNELSSAPIHRIIKKAGATRVSEDAAEELKRVLETVGQIIAKEAIGLPSMRADVLSRGRT